MGMCSNKTKDGGRMDLAKEFYCKRDTLISEGGFTRWKNVNYIALVWNM
jgi:hypothetical protein